MQGHSGAASVCMLCWTQWHLQSGTSIYSGETELGLLVISLQRIGITMGASAARTHLKTAYHLCPAHEAGGSNCVAEAKVTPLHSAAQPTLDPLLPRLPISSINCHKSDTAMGSAWSLQVSVHL